MRTSPTRWTPILGLIAILALAASGCGVKATISASPPTSVATTEATTTEATTTEAPTTEATTQPPITEIHPSTTAAGGGTATGSSNPKVAAYCQAVNQYVGEVKAAGSDPTKLAGLAADGEHLATLAQQLATGGLTTKDAQAISDCSEKATQALSGG